MNPSGSHQTQLTDDTGFKSSPRLSPNGRRIVFQRVDTIGVGTGCLWLMNADGTHAHQLYPPGPECATGGRDPAWSPDGTQIAFVNEDNGIMVINADGTDAHVLLPDGEPVRECCLAWSPDGTKIAYTYDGVIGNQHIVVANVDGSGAFLLTGDHPPFQDTFDAEPSWSPDGTRIAFVGKLDPTFMAPSGIWVINADGSNPVQLTDQFEGEPSWAPDGHHIAFTGGPAGGPAGVWKMKPDGTQQQELAVPGDQPNWSSGPRITGPRKHRRGHVQENSSA